MSANQGQVAYSTKLCMSPGPAIPIEPKEYLYQQCEPLCGHPGNAILIKLIYPYPILIKLMPKVLGVLSSQKDWQQRKKGSLMITLY